MFIQVIKGSYGYNNGCIVTPKSPSDPPFEVDDAEADRLCALGIAKKVRVGGELPAQDNLPEGPEEPEKPDESDKAVGDTVGNEDDEDDVPEYSEESSNADLQSIAKEYGIAVPNRANKAELLEALDEYFGSAPKLRS